MAEVNLLLSTKLNEALRASEDQLDSRLEDSLDKKLKPIEAKLQEALAENARLKQREEELNAKMDGLSQSVSTASKTATDLAQDRLGTLH